MTTPVRIQQRIRQLDGQGLNHTRIARELGVSRTTVIKYVSRDYSPSPREGAVGSRSLVTGEYARAADEWLTSDLRMPRKQRHTARRVHERLVAELGFPGEYSSVQRWVKRWREAHRRDSDGYAELEWAPGTAQVDYGLAKAVVAGVERTVHYLAVSFPYSNMRYVAALPGETTECVCHGLLQVFGHMGMAPRVLVFDNATGVGHCNADGTVTQTRLFSLFSAHYGFETRFCNPYAGHEKGSVENAVGFVRRNLMVPEPAAEGWDALSRAWLDECDAIARREHYRQAAPIRDLFETDLDHMLPLPGTPFDACDWRSVKTDRTGTAPVRWQPVSRRSEMAFHAPPGRCQGPGHRDARPRRGIHRDAGTRMGPRAAHRHGTDDAAGDHRAQAPDVGREPDPGRFPRKRARPARPNGWTGARRPGRRHQACVLDQRVRGRRQGRLRDHRCRTPARPRLDRPDRQTDQAGLYLFNGLCTGGGGDVLLDSGFLVL